MSTDATISQTETENLLALLDKVDAVSGAAELRGRSYQLLGLSPGARVVDVGCGAGRAVAELIELGAHAVGVDVSERMLAAASIRWPHAEFTLAGADRLPFGDAELRGYRADKLYHEIPDPGVALREAQRVLSPGGRIVLVGQDWDTLLIDSDDHCLTRTIVHARADTIPSPRAARRYRNLLLDGGFTDVSVEVHTAVLTDAAMLPVVTGAAEAASAAGIITAEQADVWIGEQAGRAQAGRLFVALPLFLAAATRQ